MSERVRAVVLAGHAGDVDGARAALADDHPAVRAAALGALARSAALTVDDLVAALADPAPTVRRRAAEEASRLSAPATTGTGEHRPSGTDAHHSLVRASGTGEHRPSGTDAHHSLVRALVAGLGDGDLGVVEAAAHALGELPATDAAVEALAALAAGHEEVVVRETAVAALGSLGDPAGLPAVLAATTDVATVRRRAVLALAAFEGDDVEAALERLAGDRDRQVRQAAEDLLHGWGASADP